MKNVLFTTTALIAMTGSAFAASHDSMSGASVDFSGELTAGYNDVIEGGLFWEANLDMSASVDFGDNVTATASVSLLEWAGGAAGTTSNVTVEVAYTGEPFSASLKMGDLGDKGASEYFYADRDGMVIDVENHDASSDVRALIEFGSIGVAVGCQSVAGVCSGVNFGAGATFGSIELGVGYDDTSGGQTQTTAVSADATFGGFEIGVSYADGTSSTSINTGVDGDDTDDAVTGATTTFVQVQNSIGVELGYEISSALSVNGYYATNSITGDNYGVSASFTSGALEVGAYFDHEVVYLTTSTGVDVDGDGFYTGGIAAVLGSVDSYGIDVAYTISEQLTANAGYMSDGTGVYYVGIDYTVNDNITATVSYATADEINGPEYKDGISAFITATF